MNDKKRNNENVIFGNKLRSFRKAKGYTLEQFSEITGIDPKHLSRIENGKYFPSLPNFNKILNALGLNVEDVGLDLSKVETIENPIMQKALQILNSAQTDEELDCYLDALKTTQKALKRNLK